MKWFRRNWPRPSGHAGTGRNVAIVSVNFNTVEKLSHLLFSLFRILGRDQFCKVVVVDNGSTDGSIQILQSLQKAGLIDLIANRTQRYHGPALNQAMNYLACVSRKAATALEVIDYVWILDSDTIVLCREAVIDALTALKASGAGIAGQYQDDLRGGFPHLSSLLVDPVKVWQRSLDPFQESGTPGAALHYALRKRGLPDCNFPFRARNYVLHLGRATLSTIYQQADSTNRYYDWAIQHHENYYHGNPLGAAIYQSFKHLFDSEVPSLSPEQLTAACQRNELLCLKLPTTPADQERNPCDGPGACACSADGPWQHRG